MPEPRNLTTTDLAVERTRIASDRTLMAWVRTAVSLVGFGFSIPHFFRYLQDTGGGHAPKGSGPMVLGMMLIGLGTCALLGGIFEHLQLLRRLAPGRVAREALSASFATATCMLAFGVFAFVNVLIRS